MRTLRLAAALALMAPLATACVPQITPCPAIAQAPVVSVTVQKSYVPFVRTLRLEACQSGTCKEGELELMPGTTPIDQGCRDKPEGVCSATSSPDGTLHGQLWMDALTEEPIAATLTGTGSSGARLPVRTLTFKPKETYPFGLQCGKVLTANLLLDAKGLRQA